MLTHGSFPQPGCPKCESLARRAGHESVAAYLEQKAAREVTALKLPDRELVAA
jgi:hypothetical protein